MDAYNSMSLRFIHMVECGIAEEHSNVWFKEHSKNYKQKKITLERNLKTNFSVNEGS